MVLVKTLGVTKIPYVVISYDEMTSMGLVLNPNMYIGNGYMFCGNCNDYTYHFAMSHRGQADCYELCKDCNSYVAPRATAILKGLAI